MRLCSVEGCSGKHRGNGYCNKHYTRVYRYGDPNISIREYHGMARSDEYVIWNHMKDRCSKSALDSWRRYGERGIYVCDEWKNSFKSFYRDMGPRPEGKQIDRINNDGPYCKENCRWVTPAENSRNRSTSKLTIDDVIYIRRSEKTNSELSKEFNCKRQTIGNIRKYRSWKEVLVNPNNPLGPNVDVDEGSSKPE